MSFCLLPEDHWWGGGGGAVKGTIYMTFEALGTKLETSVPGEFL